MDSVPSSSAPPVRPGCSQSHPLHVQKLQQMLDLNPFLNQLETLLSSPIRIPGTSLVPLPGTNVQRSPHSVFSVKGIWNTEEERKIALHAFYNFKTIRKRKWLKNILLEESDSDSDGEQPMTEQDLKILLKIHRCRRKYQKKYHADILNSQYTYYGAGLLSEHDQFPEHQKYVLDQYGFGCIEEGSTFSMSLADIESSFAPPPSVSTFSDSVCGDVSSGLCSPSSVKNAPKQSIKEKTITPIDSIPSENTDQDQAGTSARKTAADIKSHNDQVTLWKEIVNDEIPKAYNEKYIARTYKSIVTKNLAVWCANFVEQSGEKGKKKKSQQEIKKE